MDEDNQIKDQYTWDEIFKALDFLEEYDNRHYDNGIPCPPAKYQQNCVFEHCKQCRLKFALLNTIN